MEDDKLKQIQKLLDAAEGNLHSARNMLREALGNPTAPLDSAAKAAEIPASTDTTIIEGIFNGEEMIAPDGKNYPVPANYSSKSKLVEGDGLKLTIAEDGSFIYKQIKPVDRKNIVGTLAQADDGYAISAEGKNYKVLTASVTFYKAEPGDTVTAIIPTDHDATWAAMENLVSKGEIPPTEPTPADAPVIEEPATVEAPVEPTTTEPEQTMGEATIEPPVSAETPSEPAQPATDLPPLDLPPLEPIQPAEPEATPDETPEIVMPEGNTGTPLTDEQLLENLKANLRNIDTSNTTAPATEPMAPTAPDTTSTPEPTPPAEPDKPIQELDI